jgi:hypothetical protein
MVRLLAPQSAVFSENAVGELIGAYHTYYSNGVLAQKLEPDLGLSLDSDSVENVTAVKLFTRETKSILAFLDHRARNVSLLLDQQELCETVISENVLTDLGFTQEDKITDLTVVGFQHLVALIKTQLVVFDCEPVLRGASPTVRYMMTIDVKDSFSRVEALDEGIPRSVLLLGRQAP